MDTLTEIEAAVETLPAEEKEELLRFITGQLRYESVVHSQPVVLKRSRRGFPISHGRSVFSSADVARIEVRSDGIPFGKLENQLLGKNRYAVTDEIAFRMVFRLLTRNDNNPGEKKRLKSYIRQKLGVTSPQDVNFLLNLASRFKARIRHPDEDLLQIKHESHHNGHPNYSQIELHRMRTLESERVRIIGDTIREIPPRLAESLRRNIAERVKPNIRIK